MISLPQTRVPTMVSRDRSVVKKSSGSGGAWSSSSRKTRGSRLDPCVEIDGLRNSIDFSCAPAVNSFNSPTALPAK